MVDDQPGRHHKLSYAQAISTSYNADASSPPEPPPVCQGGQLGRVHQLSYARSISTGYSAAAAEMIERGTCHCGQYVARFVSEGQDLADSRVALFPVAELAAVVAGLADEPLGPELPSGVTCERCHAANVTAGAHRCPGVLGSAAAGNASEHEPIAAARAKMMERRLERLNLADQRLAKLVALTDQQLAELPVADPFGEGDILRGATWRNPERAERTLDEQARFLILACPQLTLALNQDFESPGDDARDSPRVQPLSRGSGCFRALVAGSLGVLAVLLIESSLTGPAPAASPGVSVAPVGRSRVPADQYQVPAGYLQKTDDTYVWITSDSTITPRSNARKQQSDQSDPQVTCAALDDDPVAFASCGR